MPENKHPVVADDIHELPAVACVQDHEISRTVVTNMPLESVVHESRNGTKTLHFQDKSVRVLNIFCQKIIIRSTDMKVMFGWVDGWRIELWAQTTSLRTCIIDDRLSVIVAGLKVYISQCTSPSLFF